MVSHFSYLLLLLFAVDLFLCTALCYQCEQTEQQSRLQVIQGSCQTVARSRQFVQDQISQDTKGYFLVINLQLGRHCWRKHYPMPNEWVNVATHYSILFVGPALLPRAPVLPYLLVPLFSCIHFCSSLVLFSPDSTVEYFTVFLEGPQGFVHSHSDSIDFGMYSSNPLFLSTCCCCQVCDFSLLCSTCSYLTVMCKGLDHSIVFFGAILLFVTFLQLFIWHATSTSSMNYLLSFPFLLMAEQMSATLSILME